MIEAGPFAELQAKGAEAERAAIVAWLRRGGANVFASKVMKDIARAIESGDHLKDRPS